jgi:hypothetical protein
MSLKLSTYPFGPYMFVGLTGGRSFTYPPYNQWPGGNTKFIKHLPCYNSKIHYLKA